MKKIILLFAILAVCIGISVIAGNPPASAVGGGINYVILNDGKVIYVDGDFSKLNPSGYPHFNDCWKNYTNYDCSHTVDWSNVHPPCPNNYSTSCAYPPLYHPFRYLTTVMLYQEGWESHPTRATYYEDGTTNAAIKQVGPCSFLAIGQCPWCATNHLCGTNWMGSQGWYVVPMMGKFNTVLIDTNKNCCGGVQ